VVRVFEIDGDLDAAVEHMVRASELSDVGQKLSGALDDTVDLTSSDGLRRFFRDQMMSIVTDRPPREEPPEDPEVRASLSRFALIYPFKPGKAAESEHVYQGGGRPPLAAGGQTKLRSTTVFRKGDLVVRAFDIYGDLEEAIEHMARLTEIADVGEKLKGKLDDRVDLTSPEGVRQFFRDQMMDVVTDRPPPEE
jgi:predicted nucleotidyltransferase